ncbi:hypothetical protein [Breoghania sp.]|uniref:hypothetical protein n=1 Tax=Breoghania sp. TaxID=2065378 RepID=UPI002620484D|nr:hypothetical protein [Breoghania sp.]MDJ0932084.1 hypothetical protein [Breoghania sp.]
MLPSIISQLQSDLGINQAVAGFLTTLPVLCFGIGTPLAAFVLRRISIEQAIFVTLWGVVLGSILRSVDGISMAMAGTLVIGMALTFGNIVVLQVIARDFQRFHSIMTAVLVSAMSLGATLTSALTVPMAISPDGGSPWRSGRSWRSWAWGCGSRRTG